MQVKVVQQYVGELLDQDQKFLIFCHHKVMNDGIAEILNKCAQSRNHAWASCLWHAQVQGAGAEQRKSTMMQEEGPAHLHRRVCTFRQAPRPCAALPGRSPGQSCPAVHQGCWSWLDTDSEAVFYILALYTMMLQFTTFCFRIRQ